MSIKQAVGAFCIRVAAILIVTAGLILLPDPQGGGQLLHYKNTAVSLLAVILIGVALYDTLFYQRRHW